MTLVGRGTPQGGPRCFPITGGYETNLAEAHAAPDIRFMPRDRSPSCNPCQRRDEQTGVRQEYLRGNPQEACSPRLESIVHASGQPVRRDRRLGIARAIGSECGSSPERAGETSCCRESPGTNITWCVATLSEQPPHRRPFADGGRFDRARHHFTPRRLRQTVPVPV
jgi:hypothetical protein